MSYTVVIPARYGSSRLPGKPLLDIAGKPMVQRVWERANQSGAERVVVATDDERIHSTVQSFGGYSVMTSPDHLSGTDRLQQVARELQLEDDHVVVNVQGDEPLIPAAVIDQVAENLERTVQAGIATLCEPIHTVEEVRNPNAVKVVVDANDIALYFSRAPIPWPREAFAADAQALPSTGSWLRHIGVYAYRTGFLHRYVTWPPAPLELLEQLEQLRALHNGVHIHVARAAAPVPAGVDTVEDLEAVRDLIIGGGG